MRFSVKVYVRPRPEVLDPQGEALSRALRALGFPVDGVRVGKLIQLQLEAADRRDAEGRLRAMCEQLLANPVIEDYQWELSPCG